MVAESVATQIFKIGSEVSRYDHFTIYSPDQSKVIFFFRLQIEFNSLSFRQLK